jgi:hypothetical protein
MTACRICGATCGECVAPHSAPVHEVDIKEGAAVTGPLEEIEVEVRPGVFGTLQLNARDKARLVPAAAPESEPKRKARPVASNKAVGTASGK